MEAADVATGECDLQALNAHAHFGLADTDGTLRVRANFNEAEVESHQTFRSEPAGSVTEDKVMPHKASISAKCPGRGVIRPRAKAARGRDICESTANEANLRFQLGDCHYKATALASRRLLPGVLVVDEMMGKDSIQQVSEKAVKKALVSIDAVLATTDTNLGLGPSRREGAAAMKAKAPNGQVELPNLQLDDAVIGAIHEDGTFAVFKHSHGLRLNYRQSPGFPKLLPLAPVKAISSNTMTR